MSVETISRRYATALFELAQEAGTLDATAADLQTIAHAIEGDVAVRRFFRSPVVDRRGKSALMERSFAGKVGPLALKALALLIRKRREALLGPIVHEYRKLLLEQKRREPLTIASARPIAPGELDRMVAELSRVYSTQFEISTTVDPSLLGGVQIKMGDRYIDGSISGRLDELSRELFANRYTYKEAQR